MLRHQCRSAGVTSLFHSCTCCAKPCPRATGLIQDVYLFPRSVGVSALSKDEPAPSLDIKSHAFDCGCTNIRSAGTLVYPSSYAAGRAKSQELLLFVLTAVPRLFATRDRDHQPYRLRTLNSAQHDQIRLSTLYYAGSTDLRWMRRDVSASCARTKGSGTSACHLSQNTILTFPDGLARTRSRSDG
jgi:hypothetical protein